MITVWDKVCANCTHKWAKDKAAYWKTRGNDTNVAKAKNGDGYDLFVSHHRVWKGR